MNAVGSRRGQSSMRTLQPDHWCPAPPQLSRNVLRPACGSVGPCSICSCLSRQMRVASLLGSWRTPHTQHPVLGCHAMVQPSLFGEQTCH